MPADIPRRQRPDPCCRRSAPPSDPAPRIQITELDVTDENAPSDEAVRDRLVADTYGRFLDAALDEPAVRVVVTWGLSDRHSWIVRKETHESKRRADGLPSWPLPFDADLKPKPAFEAIAQAFVHAPQRAAG